MNSRQIALTALLALAGSACGEDPSLNGKVVDLWGAPVPGATVTLGDDGSAAKANKNGGFSIKQLKSGTYKLAAEKEGYIGETFEVKFNAEADASSTKSLSLTPEPTIDGYSLVGPKGYLQLEPVTVKRVGTDIKSFQGIESTGDIEIDGANVRVVFHTPLKMDQVARLDIELHRLEFVRETEIGTVDGTSNVDVNLWVDAGKVEYTQATKGSDDNYVFEMSKLPSGSYAFVSMSLLDAKSNAFDAIAEPVRKVHAFTVK
jgi:hypothetical protein